MQGKQHTIFDILNARLKFNIFHILDMKRVFERMEYIYRRLKSNHTRLYFICF